MSKTVSFEVWGGFHNMRVLKLRLKIDGKSGCVVISRGQRAKIESHICGIKGCMCGLRDIEVFGISKQEFSYAMSESKY
jgi:hypothetical protein